MPTFATRTAIPEQYKWNAESVYPTRDAWRTDLDGVIAALPILGGFQGRLGENAKILADFFELIEPINQRVARLFMYAVFSQSVDSDDMEAKALVGQVGSMYGQFQATVSFIDPELIAIGHEKLIGWMNSEPRLKIYGHYVDNLFRMQAHVRSTEVEEVLGLVSDPLGAVDDTFEVLMTSDVKFAPVRDRVGNTHELTQGLKPKYDADPDREIRRTAWENYADAHLQYKNTLANNLLVAFKRDIFFARARRHESSLAATLSENNIPIEVYRALIDTFKKNLPTWHKYWAVKRRALRVETLHPFDVWAPLTAENPDVSYEQAIEWISAGMRPLGDDYVNTLRAGCLEQRWVDVYPNTSKRQGAFSYGAQGTHPFIMMSFNDDLNAMSTLAHELGHSMHSYYTWKNQPSPYSSYTLFVAEVASNFNQAMVRDHLMKTNTDPAFQIALITEAMYNFHRYFFVMPTLARWELDIHERLERGEGVTADDMISLMADLLEEGYGGELVADRQRSGITWATFGHLYANYYVYQYATGIAAAHALAANVLAGESGAAERYIQFLSAGSSLYPIEALKLAGVDMTRPDPVEKAFATLASYVDRLDQLTK
jgi:oligoendopeptidase F